MGHCAHPIGEATAEGLSAVRYARSSCRMRVSFTSGNRLTLPKSVLDSLGVGPAPTILEVSVEDGRIILTPVQDGRADAARDKLADIGISDTDIADAVARARRR